MALRGRKPLDETRFEMAQKLLSMKGVKRIQILRTLKMSKNTLDRIRDCKDYDQYLVRSHHDYISKVKSNGSKISVRLQPEQMTAEQFIATLHHRLTTIETNIKKILTTLINTPIASADLNIPVYGSVSADNNPTQKSLAEN